MKLDEDWSTMCASIKNIQSLNAEYNKSQTKKAGQTRRNHSFHFTLMSHVKTGRNQTADCLLLAVVSRWCPLEDVLASPAVR